MITLHGRDMRIVGFKASQFLQMSLTEEKIVITLLRSITTRFTDAASCRSSNVHALCGCLLLGRAQLWLALLTEMAYRFNSPSLQRSITHVGLRQVSAGPSTHPKVVIAARPRFQRSRIIRVSVKRGNSPGSCTRTGESITDNLKRVDLKCWDGGRPNNSAP
jgi:hypothetical protein